MFLSYFKRLSLMSFGQIVMAVSFLGLGSFTILGNQKLVIYFTLIFIFAFNFGIGSIMWVYTSEILDQRGYGIVGLVNM